MADQKLSQLTAATTPLTGTESLYAVQSGNSRKTTAQAVANLAPGTDLSYTAGTRTLASSTGDDVVLPLATTSDAGLQSAADKTRIDQLGADDSPTFAGLTITGTDAVTIPHIHGELAGPVYIHVKQTGATTLAKGTPVYVVGAVGDTSTLEVQAADASDPAKMPAIGLLGSSLAQNASGHAIVAGELLNAATGSYAVGDPLYVAAGGGLTATRPTSGTIQQVAIVGRAQAETGSLTATIASQQDPNWDLAYSQRLRWDGGATGLDAATGRTSLGLGTAATTAATDYALAGAIGSSGLSMGAGLLGRETGSGAIDTFTIGSGLAIVGGALTATGGGSGTVTSVELTVPTGLSVAGSPITTAGTLAISFAAGYSIPSTSSQSNWDTAYSERLRWDGGATGLDAATGRTSLGLGSLATQSGTFSGSSSGTNTGDVTLGASVADVLDISGQVLAADDPGADRILFWDDSESKLRHLSLAGGLSISGTVLTVPVEIGLACSDETTALTTGTAKVTFRMPYAMTLQAVRAGVTTAPTGSTLVVDINEGGTSVLSTKLSIDAGEKTSTTAATAAVISDSALADDAEITVDIDQIGATVAGAGLKVWLIGVRA
ncbi:MAG: hypothetical protein ACO3GP_04130 [Candidatus Limnocylindrus sp.]